MNIHLQNFARTELKNGLSKLPEDNQMLFKRMYSPNNLDLDIEDIVDSMPEDRLDWAMTQVYKTLENK